MASRWVGGLVAAGIVAAVGVVLVLNLEDSRKLSRTTPQPPVAPAEIKAPAEANVTARPANFREYPIGEDERDGIRVAAVWLPAIHMEGMPQGSGGPEVIHLEADVRALAENPNGFAKGEFVPYMTIRYEIAPATGGEPMSGTMIPMVARDGLHYGASVSLPKPGKYKLTYRVEPPSSGGLGRHDDPVTGVGPWWKPFALTWDWDYEGTAAAAGGKTL